jgi:hypothetical protein
LIEEKIKSCHAYIGNFHKKWVYVPTNSNPDGLSVTTIFKQYCISNTSISFKSDYWSRAPEEVGFESLSLG